MFSSSCRFVCLRAYVLMCVCACAFLFYYLQLTSVDDEVSENITLKFEGVR